jgi:hypothetical protein
MSFVIIFTLGYVIGGVSALLIVGLTLAARAGDRREALPIITVDAHPEPNAIWRERP